MKAAYCTKVKFSRVKEVRILPGKPSSKKITHANIQLKDQEAEDAHYARRSYESSKLVVQRILNMQQQMSLKEVAVVSLALSVPVSPLDIIHSYTFRNIQYRSYVLGHPGFFSNHCRNTRSFIQKIRRSRTSVCTSNNLLPLLFFRRTNVASFVATVWRYKGSTVTLSIYSAF